MHIQIMKTNYKKTSSLMEILSIRILYKLQVLDNTYIIHRFDTELSFLRLSHSVRIG